MKKKEALTNRPERKSSNFKKKGMRLILPLIRTPYQQYPLKGKKKPFLGFKKGDSSIKGVRSSFGHLGKFGLGLIAEFGQHLLNQIRKGRSAPLWPEKRRTSRRDLKRKRGLSFAEEKPDELLGTRWRGKETARSCLMEKVLKTIRIGTVSKRGGKKGKSP